MNNLAMGDFISKEKDIESSLGDFGVRKYDDETGRFTSIDPLWELQYSWSPYHYAYNNPIMGKDPSGKFTPFMHAYIDNVALGTNYLEGLAEHTVIQDLVRQEDNKNHFVNCQNYNEVMKIVDDAGGWSGLNTHQIGDFFAHSNYIDIWTRMELPL